MGALPQIADPSQSSNPLEQYALAPYGVDESDTDKPQSDECFAKEADCDSDQRRSGIADLLYHQFDQYRSSPQRQEAERMWRAADRLYYGFKETNSPNEVVIREVWRQEQTMITQLAKGLTAGEVLFTATARLEGFDEEAEGATAIIHDQLKRTGSRDQMDMFIKCFQHYGNAYMVPGFRKFKWCQYKSQSMHADGEQDWWDKETSEVVENLPYLENVTCWDVYAHPRVEEARNSPYVFIVREVAPDGLKTLIREGYIDADATRAAVEAGQTGDTDRSGIRGMWNDEPLQFLNDDDRPHELIICWSIDGWEHVVLDREFLVRAMPLPDGKIPIIDRRFDPMPDKHYSFGLPITIADEQRVVNQIVAYKLANLGFACNPIVLAKRGSDAKKNWNNATIKAGTCVEVDTPGDLTYLQMPATQGLMSDEISYWQGHQKEQTGITDRLAGNGPNSGTATGASQLTHAASERLENMIRMLMPAFEQMYRWMYNLNARHMDDAYAMRIVGKDGADAFKRYTPEIFTPDVDVNVEVGGGVSTEQAMNWGNLIKTLGSVPGFDVQMMGDEMLKASGVMRPKKFHTSSTNSQGDALGENQQIMAAGIIADPKPSDDHAAHLQIHSLLQSNPQFATMPPAFQQALQSHMAIHQQFLQQQQAANAQQQQAAMQQMGGGQGPQGGATPVQQTANATANGMFNMGQRGAMQQGAA